MKPLLTYLKNQFDKLRILGGGLELNGLVAADSILDSLVNEKRIPGLAITVLKEGKVLHQKGYGYADLENKVYVNPRNTIFRIASVSKPIAATALAYMVADGQIDLDASFYTYVPYSPKKKWDFTIRQLAGHTAGIRSYRGVEYALNKHYSIKESLKIFEDDDLLFKPGTDYLYNSFDWVLISLAMQEASGIPFEKYVQQRVFAPLRMVNTFEPISGSSDHSIKVVTSSGAENPLKSLKPVSTTLDLAGRMTTFYSKNKLGFRHAIPVNNFYKLAGGGYLSTSEDIAKLGQAYLEGKMLNEDILSQFLTSQTVNGEPTYYGLGWQVSQDKSGKSFYGHIGNGVGGYSNFFVYPKEQMVFSILVNCTSPNIQDELDKVVKVLLESIPI